MVATLPRKPKTAQRTIIRREQDGATIRYYILQADHLHEVTIENGVASCNCHAYQYAPRGNKRCGDTDLALKNERERSTDLQQHVRDDIHSCILCGRRMKVDGWCGC